MFKEKYNMFYEKFFSFPVLCKFSFLKKILKYEVFSYLFFGVLTTAVNFIVFFAANKLYGNGYEKAVVGEILKIEIKWIYISNAVAWIISVIFAFITNKLFVFESKEKKAKILIKELFSFVGARIASFVLFEELLFAALTAAFKNMYYSSWIAKIICAVAVIIFNYVASKMFVFKKAKQ